jgi:tRNA A37 threonylcarbamoyladenosine dehydratase
MSEARTRNSKLQTRNYEMLANAGVEYMVSASDRVRIPAHLIYFSWDPLTDFVAINK